MRWLLDVIASVTDCKSKLTYEYEYGKAKDT
jgi:hypothetical protein